MRRTGRPPGRPTVYWSEKERGDLLAALQRHQKKHKHRSLTAIGRMAFVLSQNHVEEEAA